MAGTLWALAKWIAQRCGRDVVGIVFQQFNLIPSLNVADNLGFQARLKGLADKDWQAEITDRLGLAEHMSKYPEELSGGPTATRCHRARFGQPPRFDPGR